MPPDERFTVGYWLSSEEHGPNALVEHAVRAEATGFGSAMISDHFHPWVRSQGESPFVWSVLGGIAQATSTLRVGTGVTAPIIRMHPAIVAHAAATAAVMFDGRFFLGLGSGERLSEHVTGERWPGATERRVMLEEAVGIIRRLFDGKNVNHRGDYYRVENAQLFTLPATPPPIVLAVGGAKSAALAGRVADGMLAVTPSARAVDAFEAAGGHGKPRIGQLHVCWAESEDKARRAAREQWPNAAVQGQAVTDLARPKDFEAVTDPVSDDAATATIVCGPDPGPHVEALGRFAAAGFSEVYVHQIGPDQEGFFRFYADRVLPRFG
jgi:coenzyme F420-dependent glucose-6-phosphate dehydrogenase